MFDYLDISDPFTMGYAAESENKENARRAYDKLRATAQYSRITKTDIDDALWFYDVDYCSLDREAKDWFNEFDI